MANPDWQAIAKQAYERDEAKRIEQETFTRMQIEEIETSIAKLNSLLNEARPGMIISPSLIEPPPPRHNALRYNL